MAVSTEVPWGPPLRRRLLAEMEAHEVVFYWAPPGAGKTTFVRWLVRTGLPGTAIEVCRLLPPLPLAWELWARAGGGGS